MSDITPEFVADALKHQLLPVPLAARPILLEAIANLVCRNTSPPNAAAAANSASSVPNCGETRRGGKSPLAQEARFRANEAIYLADLLH
jgi:hypothetical protein